MRKLIFLRIVLVSLIIGAVCQNNYSQKMPADANKLYEDFCKSLENSDTAAFRSCLTTAAFINIKNEIISMGMIYPDDVMTGMKMAMLDIKQLKYVNFKKNGLTINAYYIYMVDKVETSIITLRMIEENGKLKIVDLKNRDAKDFVINLSKKDYSFLDLKEFQPTGIVDVPVKEINKIDYQGRYDVFGYGYEITIIINGFKHRGVNNSTTSGVIIGGVVKGENTIEFSIKKTDPNEKEFPVIGVRAYINDVETDVFYFNEDVQGTSIVKTFTVN